MPSRVIREGILDSARMNALVRDAKWPAEVFYRRLHSIVDDFGRTDARLDVLRAKMYPTFLDLVREVDIERWIAACVKAGLIRLYNVQEKNYIEVMNFNQFVRAKKEKYPPPPDIRCNADAVHMNCNGSADANPTRAPARLESVSIPISIPNPAMPDADDDSETSRFINTHPALLPTSVNSTMRQTITESLHSFGWQSYWDGCLEAKAKGCRMKNVPTYGAEVAATLTARSGNGKLNPAESAQAALAAYEQRYEKKP